jgi:3-oxoacyl-[acyl-carrier protein] reductase
MGERLKDRIAIVIGAAQGIGAGIAQRFLEEGASVLIADRNAEIGKATVARLAEIGPAVFAEADIGKPADIERLVSTTLRHFDRVDILVQNAGIFPWTMIEDISIEEWDRVLAVNLRGTFLAAQACLKPMKAQGYGRMVFTSSITGPRVSMPGHGHYSASKAGINGFIRAAAIEFAPYGITVNGIEPGNIATEGVRASRSAEYIRTMEAMIPLGRLGTPRDVANAALYFASEEAGYVTGTTLIVDGGQILPEGADFRIAPK